MSVKDDGFGIVMRSVMRDRSLSVKAKALYAYLCSFAGNKGSCYPARSLIEGELGISSTTASSLLNELVESGTVKKVQDRSKVGKFGNNVYVVWQRLKCDNRAVFGDSDTHFTVNGSAVNGKTDNGLAANGKTATNINNINTNNINKNKDNKNNSNNYNRDENVFLKMLRSECND